MFCIFPGAIRKASPIVVISLLILAMALGFSTVGNAKGDMKTLVGAVFYIFSGEYFRWYPKANAGKMLLFNEILLLSSCQLAVDSDINRLMFENGQV